MKPYASCAHRLHFCVAVPDDFALFYVWKSLLSYSTLLHTQAQMSLYLFCESLVLVVQGLIKVLALGEAYIIAQVLMRHKSLKLRTADGTVIPFTPRPAAFGCMYFIN